MSDIVKFIDGIARFQKQYFGETPELAIKLEKEQKPQVLLFGCSDSRVDPALLTDCAPGELFMVRNVANLVPPYQTSNYSHGVSSALEYAVRVLKVTNIVVMGHSKCGGIAELMKADKIEDIGEFIGDWLNIAAPARDKVFREMPDKSAEEQAQACEKEALLVSLKNLMTYPWVKERVTSGQLSLHGWYYNLGTGQLTYHNPLSNSFEVLVERYSPNLLSAREGAP